ncbi:MAG: hypothetical protein ACLUUO_05275 [Sellimonas intestinalis]
MNIIFIWLEMISADLYQKCEIMNLWNCFHINLPIPAVTNIEMKCKVIMPNSSTRVVDVDRAFGFSDMLGKRKVVYTPQYKNKNIMGWVEIENTKGLGFNSLCWYK